MQGEIARQPVATSAVKRPSRCCVEKPYEFANRAMTFRSPIQKY